MVRLTVSVCLALAVLVGCHDHRYGFFGNEAGSTDDTGTTTTGPDPTTVSPTTVSPTTAPNPTTEPNPTSPTTFDPTTTTTDPTDPSGPGTITVTTQPTTLTDPSTVTTDPTGMPGVCGEEPLPSVVPLDTQGTNSGKDDLFTPPCLQTFGSESVWVWTAPFDGLFSFDTIGSDFDTVLTVLEGVCEGPLLGCNDDTVQLWSNVTTKLGGGTTVTIIVDGLSGQSGTIHLNISEAVEPPPPPPCVAFDIGSQLGQFGGSTFAGENTEISNCGGDLSPEVAFVWTAPFAGDFRLRTLGSNYDPLLYMRFGECEGFEIACNDDSNGLESEIIVFLTPDDGPMFVFVDGIGGSAGEFTLEISQL